MTRANIHPTNANPEKSDNVIMLLQSSAAQIPPAHSTESPRAHTAICLVCALRRPKLGQTCRAGHGWSVVFDLHPRSRNHHGSTLTNLAKEHGLVTEHLGIGGRSGNFRPTFWKVPVTPPSLTAERQIRSGGGRRIQLSQAGDSSEPVFGGLDSLPIMQSAPWSSPPSLRHQRRSTLARSCQCAS